MKKKTILPVSRGELRAITISLLIICMSVVLPPHLARVLQAVPPPQIVITELESDKIKSHSIASSDMMADSISDHTHRSGISISESRGLAVAKSFISESHSKHRTEAKSSPCRPFDPNSISGDSLRGWGLSSYVVGNMLKYRSSGGKWRKPEDLRHVYGMDSIMYKHIEACIEIIKKTVQLLDINTADTSQWMSLPGIGPVLSKRIVKFRDKMGGFYSIEQVADTYGLPIETFESIRPNLRVHTGPVLLNLTTATETQLAAHPYISPKQARVMINYFDQHGRPKSLDDLSKLYIADSLWLARVKPYCIIDNAPVN